MGNLYADKSIALIKWMKHRVDESLITKLDLVKLERVINRLDKNTYNCDVCNQHLSELEEYLLDLEFKRKTGKLRSMDFNQHEQKIKVMISHLKKEHKLKSEGHYLNMYIPITAGFGVLLGLTLYHNIISAIFVGIILGIAVGYNFDNDNNQKDLTI